MAKHYQNDNKLKRGKRTKHKSPSRCPFFGHRGEDRNGGSGVCVCVRRLNTTVKTMKQGNHISLRQCFNQAKTREMRGCSSERRPGAVSH